MKFILSLKYQLKKGLNYLLIISSVFITCCSEEREISTIDFQNTFGNQTQTFIIKNSSDTTIIGKAGTEIYIPKGAIGNYKSTDSLYFYLQEFYTKSDIVLAGLSTTSNGKLLESNGMLHLEIIHNGKKLDSFVKPIEILFSAQNSENYKLFHGEKSGNIINWQEDTVTQNYHFIYLEYDSPQSDSAFIEEDYLNTSLFDSMAWDKSYNQYDSIYMELGMFQQPFEKLTPELIERFIKESNATNEITTKFKTKKLNWINCDRFLGFDNLTTLSISSSFKDPSIFCIFHNYNAVIRTKTNEIKNLPVGEPVTIIGLTIKDDIYLAIHDNVIVKQGLNVRLNFQISDVPSIKEKLKGL